MTAPCECSVAGFCGRHKQKKSAHLHRLCQTRDDYRALWDRLATEGPVKTSERKQKKEEEPLPPGPGTELTRLFASKGVPSCKQCKDVAQQMNALGIQGCREHRAEIIESILPRAKGWVKRNWPWTAKLLGALPAVEDAALRHKIGQYVDQAINHYEQQGN